MTKTKNLIVPILFLAFSLSLSAQDYFLVEIIKGSTPQAFSNKQAYIRLDFKNQKFSGKSVCNSFFGAWNQKNEITGIGSTMMACSPRENEIEREILLAFDKAQIKYSNQKVEISNHKITLIFKK